MPVSSTSAPAERTASYLAAYESHLCDYLKRRRTAEPTRDTSSWLALPSALELTQALGAYELALEEELKAVREQPADLHPKPVAASAVRRGALVVRGGVRLGVGVGLGLVWSTLGQYLLPDLTRAQFGHFALHTCCAGGASDIVRANGTASAALASKRDYQRKQAEHRAWLAGTWGPLDVRVPQVYTPAA